VHRLTFSLLLAFGLSVSPAQAAGPPVRPAPGVKVTWPLKASESILDPGSPLRVKVVSARRRSQLSLVSVDAAGRALKVLAKTTLRSGLFRTSVPPTADGRRFALRIRVAGRTYSSRIVARAAVPDTGPPPVFTGPIPTLCQEPEPGRANLAGSVRNAPVRGGTLDVEIVNTGQVEIELHEPYVWMLASALRPPALTFMKSGRFLPPGGRVAYPVPVAADTPPGEYTLTVHASAPGIACAGQDMRRSVYLPGLVVQ
jgi:hypothetical protein